MNFINTKSKNSTLMTNQTDDKDLSLTEDSSDPVDYRDKPERKSVEDLLNSSHEAIGNSINSVLQSSPVSLRVRSSSPASTSNLQQSPQTSEKQRPQSSSDTLLLSTVSYHTDRSDNTEDSAGKSSDSSNLVTTDASKSTTNSKSTHETDQPQSSSNKQPSKASERAKKKSWYNVLYPTYKSRSKDFKKLFKDVTDDERLIVDYSCALQKDILVQGRLYVSQHYVCFYANIFRWETCLSIKWKDVTSITKEKTALVIPNAISICTDTDKHFFASFTTRDKAFLMLFRVWQNALMDKSMQPQEMWQWVHNCYGDELGLTSDDEDYIDPYEIREDAVQSTSDTKSVCNESLSEDLSSGNLTDNMPKHRESIGEPESKSNTLVQRKVSKTNRKSRVEDNEGQGNIPTDISDSTDSETENIPFVSTAECTSPHEGRQLVHTILPINVDALFNLLFSKSKFLVEFHAIRKTKDMIMGEWITNNDGRKTRTVNLTVALTQAVGPKCSQVTEVQEMRDCSVENELYSIDINSSNAGIPYADSFYIVMHYCLVRTVDDHTMLSVHAQIKYKKSVWGVVKGFIEKNTWNGLEDFYGALLKAIQNEYCIPPAKSKSRRLKRGGTLQHKSIDESSAQPLPTTNPCRNNFNSINKSIDTAHGNNIDQPKYKTISWILVIFLLALIVLNVILYFKLYALESRTPDYYNIDISSLKNPPKTSEEWINLLKNQESLHNTEMKKWQQVLQTAIELLRKTEHSISDLISVMQSHYTTINNNGYHDKVVISKISDPIE